MNRTNETWVLKVGGRELLPGPALAELAVVVARAVASGRSVVLVHGGGDEVTRRAQELGLPTEKRLGQRVTDDAMLQVVSEVLVGRVGVRIVNALEGAGVPAVGLSGVSGQMLQVAPAGSPPGSLGWVGTPQRVRPTLLQRLLDDGLTPVVAPLGTDGSGGVYNVNADLAAGAIAASLSASLLLLTDVPAVRGPEGSACPELLESRARQLIATGTASDGMVPKLEGAIAGLRGGATSVWIGNLSGLSEDGPRPGAGTRLVRSSRPAVPMTPRSTARGTP
jgi:acetylglutamate kinase